VLLPLSGLDGATAEEREAAARALVSWPPDKFHLRVAEWGVWISNASRMALAKSVVEEIPPFVHRTGNPISSLRSYFLYPSAVSKPIVHLTSDVALAADVEVHIRAGRPWFGYPMPDDFAIGNRNDGPTHYLGSAGYQGPNPPRTPSDDFKKPPVGVLSETREGYPWLVPHHRLYSSQSLFGEGAYVFDLGLRWQSLIICPEHRAWMEAPKVPDDPRFRWWSRLRDVPSSWVASRGEAERFLYYDGPTRLPVPVAVSVTDSGHRLAFKALFEDAYAPWPDLYPKHPFEPLSATSPANLPAREGLYIEVRSGAIRGQHMTVADAPAALDLPLHGDAVVQQFRTMLTAYGLTGPEAEGLIAAWSPQFFHTEGRRFLLRMSPADYDWQCPIQVRPRPTALVRLGLVLTEFDGAAKTPGEK
jgi:hypothetical protein